MRSQHPNARTFSGKLEMGWAALSGNRGRKGGPVRRASPRRRLRASRGRGDPDGSEGFQRIMPHTHQLACA
jgi:hypothetical protein